MAVRHEGIKGRTDVYRVDPRHITVVEGWNPRTSFGDEKDDELKNSIVENGVLVPLRIKRTADDKLELIDGERRYRATIRAIEEGHDIQSVPCLFERKTINQVDALISALLSNEGKPLKASEESEAYNRLVKWGYKAEKISKSMGKSIAHVYNRLKLSDASEDVKRSVDEGEITHGQALKIVKESNGDVEKQVELAQGAKVEKRAKQARKGKKRDKVQIDVEDIRNLMNEAVSDYEHTDNEGFRNFCGGLIRAYANMLDIKDPIELDY